MADLVGQDFVLFVECVFTTRSLWFYRYDLTRLLVILRKMRNEGLDESCFAQRYDPLTMHCGYMLAKMSFDVRESIRRTPYWLSALAGHEDCLDTRRMRQMAVCRQVCDEMVPLLKKYGPDSLNTLPPPARSLNDD